MERTFAGKQTAEDLVIETEDHNEVHDTSWGDEQRMLVSLHQDVIVVCPWMDNAEVTLGTAMTTYEYPPNPTAEDEPFLISVVYELLANRVEEEDEPEDVEPELEEELVMDEGEVKPQEDEAKELEEFGWQVVEDEVSEEKIDPLITQPHLAKPVAKVYEVEKPLVGAKELSQPEAAIDSSDVQPTATVSSEISVEPISLEDEGVIGKREAETDQFVDAPEIIKKIGPEVVAMPERAVADELEGLQTEPSDELDGKASNDLEQLPDTEPFRAPCPVVYAIETERPVVLAEGATLLVNREVNPSEDKTSAGIRFYLDKRRPDSSSEEDLEVRDFQAPSFELIDDELGAEDQPEPYEEEEKVAAAEAEITAIEPPTETHIMVQQILVEHIEQGNSQSTEPSDYYLDKIVTVIEEAQALDSEGSTEQTKSIEELEELFTELFDERAIPHTPELVEELVRRTYIHKNQEFEDEDEVEDDDQSTAVMTTKKSSNSCIALDSRLISKIALELCGLKTSFNLN